MISLKYAIKGKSKVRKDLGVCGALSWGHSILGRDCDVAGSHLLLKPQEERSELWAGILQLPWVCNVTIASLALLGAI